MAKPIMIQGTMSSAGKSLTAAALCRIFKQDGYRVAPFKAQNMALNSYITDEGLEMGRAQAVQAEAAKIRPSVRMNPVLLKPTADTGSQVIVNGEVLGDMSASEYGRYKNKLLPEVKAAYESLSAEYDIIVIEGAGSPAEINLKDSDIVNMGMAKIAGAPVLLVGDIDRGGVFAQMYGTVALLEPEERAYIKGLIINKFRGDIKILEPGIKMLGERMLRLADIPVVGVIPYMHADIDDEDSLSERLKTGKAQKRIDIAAIRFPHISNFTDLNPFDRFENISLRYVSSAEDLKNPDMIVLPGTKSTIADLLWLRRSGLEAAILKAFPSGTVIFGICGGYQMLGRDLSDPCGVEGGGRQRGMGLLDIGTVFAREKTRSQTNGVFSGLGGALSGLNGIAYAGYEIHMGQSDGETAPIVSSGNVYGTYVHGVFDERGIAPEIVNCLCRRRGIEPETAAAFGVHEYKELQYDALAEAVRASVDMEKIYSILEAGIS